MRVQKIMMCLKAEHNPIVCYILWRRHIYSVDIKTKSDILCQHKFLSAPDLKSGSVNQLTKRKSRRSFYDLRLMTYDM